MRKLTAVRDVIHTMPVYARLAQLIQARENCAKTNNLEWLRRHGETAQKIIENHLPSGSGFDSGTKIDLEASNPNKVVLYVAYHHMDENGFYNGWTNHAITVKPDLAFGFTLSISGRDRNDFKEYAYQCFQSALSEQTAL